MNDQEKKIATATVGTLVFILLWMIIRASGLSLFAISVAAPNLEGGGLMAPGSGLAFGPFDIAGKALEILLSLGGAYMFGVTKIGSAVIFLVTKIVTALQQRASLSIDAKQFASASKVRDRFDSQSARLQAVEDELAQIKSALFASGFKSVAAAPVVPKPTPTPKVEE